MSDEDPIQKIEKDIEKARKEAEDAGIIEDPDEPKYYESGTVGRDLDDQQITPPG
jgi:hypothetical protein